MSIDGDELLRWFVGLGGMGGVVAAVRSFVMSGPERRRADIDIASTLQSMSEAALKRASEDITRLQERATDAEARIQALEDERAADQSRIRGLRGYIAYLLSWIAEYLPTGHEPPRPLDEHLQ